MSKRRDEQTKLLANLLNAISGACITIGLVTPIVAIFFNFGNAANDVPVWKMVVGPSAFAVAGILLHLSAKRVLDGHSE